MNRFETDDQLGDAIGTALHRHDRPDATAPDFGGVRRRARQRQQQRIGAGALACVLAAGIGFAAWQSGDDATDPVQDPDRPEVQTNEGSAERPMDYWALDLSTPDAALDAFLDAWNRGDYHAATMLLDLESSTALRRSDPWYPFEQETEGLFVDEPAWDSPEADYPLLVDTDLNQFMEQFQRWMEAGARIGAFRLDLSAGVTDRSVIDTTDQTGGLIGTLGDGTEVVVTFTTDPEGRFRVRQFATEGGDPAALPFSTPDNAGSAPIAAGDFEPFYDSIPYDDPAELADFVLTTIAERDFISMRFTLDLTAFIEIVNAEPRVDERVFGTPTSGPIVADVLESFLEDPQAPYADALIFRRVAEIGALYVDPIPPFAIDGVEQAEPPFADEPFTVVTVTDSMGQEIRVWMSEPNPGEFLVRQIAIDDGDPNQFPFSGPTIDNPFAGSEVCWDHIRFDCSRQFDPNDAPAVEEIRARVTAGEITDAEAAAEIAAISATAVPDLPQMCATMQGLRSDLVFPQSWVDLAPVIVEDHCPGDPSLLRVDPDR